MFTAAYVRAMGWFEAFVAVVSAHLRPTTRTSPAGYRAVTFIEYALLAAIAVVIAYIFRTQLSSLFENLLGNISNVVNQDSSTGA